MQPENQDGAFCPGANFSCTDGRVNFEIGRIPTYFSIASCSLSCLSSVLIVVAYLSLREIRMGSQKIITLLAIADFFTASGYLIAAGNFLTHYQHTDLHSCQVFETICEIQSFVTTWSSLCSFVWTCTLALYFYLIVVKNKQRLAVRLLPWENIIAWFIPMLITLPLLVTGRLGYSPYAASNWCFIKDNYQQSLNDHIVTILLIFVGGKFWEIMSYFIVIILYGITRVKFRQMQVQHLSGIMSYFFLNSFICCPLLPAVHEAGAAARDEWRDQAAPSHPSTVSGSEGLGHNTVFLLHGRFPIQS